MRLILFSTFNYAGIGEMWNDAVDYSWEPNYDIGDNLHDAPMLILRSPSNLRQKPWE